MQCQCDALTGILPVWLRSEVDKQTLQELQEIRLRIQKQVELVYKSGSQFLNRKVNRDDISFCINTACQYSPWSADTVRYGYITAQGGHRIGICGNVIHHKGIPSEIRNVTSICIRVSKDIPGLAETVSNLRGSTIIIGPPGCGKTTFLRDFIRQKSNSGIRISVVDERMEIFPEFNSQFCFQTGIHTDVLSGCAKAYGIEAMLRCMSPEMIAVDEITAEEDCKALLYAAWCGVSLIATAHAGCKEDLFTRPVYKPLIDAHLFNNIIIINKSKIWTVERMG